MAEELIPDAFMTLAMKRFTLSNDAWAKRRASAKEEIKFAKGGIHQWIDKDATKREQDGRPILTINRIPQFIRQVTNDQRQNRSGIKVAPTDSRGDPKTAEILQGLVRHIERSSGADATYDTAFEHAAKGGFGWIRVLLEYENEDSFNRRPVIKRCRNPLMVYPDPFAVEPDYSDMDWAFVIQNLPKEEYKRRFPESQMVVSGLLESTTDERVEGWMDEATVRIAEYFEFTKSQREIVLVEDLDGQRRIYDYEKRPTEFTKEIDRRKVEVRKLKHHLINGIEKLETTDWPGKYIPLIPVLGEEIDVDGEVELVGMVRNAMDPQRMINYWTSCLTEQIALAPKPPWIGAEGQFEGHEGEWAVANTDPFGYLEYKPVDVNGNFAPAPQRTAIEPAIQAITQALMHSESQLKAVMGLYDASLGARSNETSGIAIQARQVEGETANFHLVDNLARATRHTGRVIIDLIPKVMPPQTVARIIGDDLQERSVTVINDPKKLAYLKGDGQDPLTEIYNIGVGKYDIDVQVGPSFRTKREQMVKTMLELAKAYPGIREKAGDIITAMMDFPMAEKLAERLRPPGYEGEGNEEVPPQIQAQLQQLMSERETMIAQVEELTKTIDTKRIEQEGKKEIEGMKLDAELKIEQLKADLQQAKLNVEMMINERRLVSQEDLEMFKADYRREMAEAQQRIDALTSGSQQ